MILIQNGFKCDYEMNIFINIFFSKKDEGKIITDVFYENGIISAKTEIEFEGKKYLGEFCCPMEAPEGKALKKFSGVCCTRSFIAAASKIKKINLPWGVLSGIRPAKYVRELKAEGKTKSEIENILTDIFGVSEKKCRLAMEVSENEEKILKGIKNDAVSIYIGIPFCPSRCIYCSFVSTDVKISGKYMDDFTDCLLKEIAKTAEILKEASLSVQNIYIGGGTPTTLSGKNLKRVMDAINSYFDMSGISEFTLEAGRPDTVDVEKLIIAKAAGVDRISINPQTLNQITLDKIGRKHTVDMFYEAFEKARRVGFRSINTDLIAGLPDEDFEMFKKSIDGITELDPENITVHSMCVKRSARLNSDGAKLTEADLMDKMISYADETMKRAGKAPYYMYRQKNISGNLENVGFSDKDCFSMYNIAIMEEVQTIIALGGGGVSKLVKGDRIERIPNFKEPYEYIRRFDEIIKRKDEAKELILL